MTKLDQALANAGVSNLGLDTAPIIYFVEAHPNYDQVMTEVFRQITDGELKAATSTITLTEVLVQPLRQGNTVLQARYKTLLLGSHNFSVVDIDAETAERAADLRARYNIKTPDSLQIAAALSAGCEAFLTNDRDLRRVTDLQIFVLNELEL